jgi:pimeloyl-ACP methyl ester carboxylesterase
LGAVTAWQCALRHPERVRAVASLSVPFAPRPPAPPIARFRAQFGSAFFYILYFQEPRIAEAELEADVRRSLRLFYYASCADAPTGTGFLGKPVGAKLLDGMIDPPALPPWLSEADLDHAAAELRRSGFRGPLQRYRAIDRDWEDLDDLEGATVRAPALYITGERDLGHLFVPGAIDTMRKHVHDLRDAIVLPGVGHWTQQEAAESVSRALIDFATRLEK